MDAEPIQVTRKVVSAFEQLGIPYLIGGSVASAVHGVVRATMDADVVADIKFNRMRYTLVDGTRPLHFGGIHFKPYNLPENAATPTRRVHAVSGGLLAQLKNHLTMNLKVLRMEITNLHPARLFC